MASELPKRSRPHVALGPQRARRPRVRPPAVPPSRSAGDGGTRPRTPPLLLLTRHGIAALAVLAGIVAMCFGTESSLIGGAGLIGAGLASWLIAWLYRLGVEGDRDREAEERARGYFERHGRWPVS
jgi:hypothetical protein